MLIFSSLSSQLGVDQRVETKQQGKSAAGFFLPEHRGHRPGRAAPLPAPGPALPARSRGRRGSAGGGWPARPPASRSAARSSRVDATRGATPRVIVGAGFSRGRLGRWALGQHGPTPLTLRGKPLVPRPRGRARLPRAAGPRGVPAATRSPRLAPARRRDAGVSELQPSLFWGKTPPALPPGRAHTPPAPPAPVLAGRLAGDACGHRPACLFPLAAPAADLKG